jgi:hypothetical protein
LFVDDLQLFSVYSLFVTTLTIFLVFVILAILHTGETDKAFSVTVPSYYLYIISTLYFYFSISLGILSAVAQLSAGLFLAQFFAISHLVSSPTFARFP